MVLEGIGRSIQGALHNLTRKSVIDDDAVDDMIKTIQRALLESDVNVKLVVNLKNNIKKNLDLENMPSGLNKKRVIQQTVFKELVKLCNPGVEAYKPVKGRCNVVIGEREFFCQKILKCQRVCGSKNLVNSPFPHVRRFTRCR